MHASPNLMTDSLENTRLHVAVENGNAEMCELLLNRGATHVPNRFGTSPLIVAIYRYCEAFWELVFAQEWKNGERIPQLLAAEKGAMEICKLLLNRGATHAPNLRGDTPLHIAAENGALDLCSLLLDRGAPVDARNRRGQTSLYVAADEGRFEICKLLLDRGAAVDTVDDSGMTPLHIASYNERVSVCELLLGRGASHLVQDRFRRTAFELAASNRNDSRTFELLFARLVDAVPGVFEARIRELTKNVHVGVPVRAFLALKFPQFFRNCYNYKVTYFGTISDLVYTVQTTMPKLPRRLALKIVFWSHVAATEWKLKRTHSEIIEVIAMFMDEPLSYFEKMKFGRIDAVKRGLEVARALTWPADVVSKHGIPLVWLEEEYWKSPTRPW